MEIKFIDRENSKECTEKVYGDKAIELLYETLPGKFISGLLASKMISQIYGGQQDSRSSKKKISPFISNYNINMEEFLPEEGRDTSDPYSSFNQFFIRRFKQGKRVFAEETSQFSSPCEARYFAYEELSESDSIPVKGSLWNAKALLKNDEWAKYFDNGPALLARLCPVDYHRFHFPDSGKVLDSYPIPGAFHSVNPIALKANQKIFKENERFVSILDTENFGKIAYVEVGAMMVGKIIQSTSLENFKKGDEKGYFLFGGSTVIVFGEKGKWSPSRDILVNTKKGIETYVKLGSTLGHAI
jgi:phosphatidylserine decarboxylase